MKIHILCTDPQHPVNAWLNRWCEQHAQQHEVRILRRAAELSCGDYLFLISCHEIIRQASRAPYRHTLVIHASDLPKGRGMSPHIWQIIEGAHEIPVTLLNAEDALDSGDIWQQIRVHFKGHELHDDINRAIFDAELALMTWAITNCDTTRSFPQQGEPTFYRKRTPIDSRVDASRSMESQFDLLRVADPIRYPAYIELRGKRFKITLTRMDD